MFLIIVADGVVVSQYKTYKSDAVDLFFTVASNSCKMFGKILTYLLVIIYFGKFTYLASESSLYLRTGGVKLNASTIEETINMKSEQCLGVCLHNNLCKAFNAFPGSVGSPPRCEFFNKDKCSPDIVMLNDANFSYFDTIGNKKCPRKLI